jgi:hypothetical protein
MVLNFEGLKRIKQQLLLYNIYSVILNIISGSLLLYLTTIKDTKLLT